MTIQTFSGEVTAKEYRSSLIKAPAPPGPGKTKVYQSLIHCKDCGGDSWYFKGDFPACAKCYPLQGEIEIIPCLVEWPIYGYALPEAAALGMEFKKGRWVSKETGAPVMIGDKPLTAFWSTYKPFKGRGSKQK